MTRIPTTRTAVAVTLLAGVVLAVSGGGPPPLYAAQPAYLWLNTEIRPVGLADDLALWFKGEIRRAMRQQGNVLTDADINELAGRAATAFRRGARDIRVCTQTREQCLAIEVVNSATLDCSIESHPDCQVTLVIRDWGKTFDGYQDDDIP